MAFKLWNTNSRSIPPAKKGLPLPDVLLLSGIFRLGQPKKSCSTIYFPTRFTGNFLLMVNNQAMQDNQEMNLLPETSICFNCSKNHFIIRKCMGVHFTRLDLKCLYFINFINLFFSNRNPGPPNKLWGLFQA